MRTLYNINNGCLYQNCCSTEVMGAIKKNIPNVITCLNLLSGCIGIVLLVNRMPIEASYCMFAAAVFDFLDGLIARALKVASPIGKDLDSLADVITFGLLPGLMVVHMCLGAGVNPWVSLTGLIIPVFSAVRLAIFNNDTEQSYSFKGLATPANGLFWACVNIAFFKAVEPVYGINTFGIQVKNITRDFLPVTFGHIAENSNWLGKLAFNQPWILLVATVILCFLLISRLDLIAFKLNKFTVKRYAWHFVLLGTSIISIIVWGFASAPIILFLYILISQIYFRTRKHEI